MTTTTTWSKYWNHKTYVVARVCACGGRGEERITIIKGIGGGEARMQ
jgi:hypothetical protein